MSDKPLELRLEDASTWAFGDCAMSVGDQIARGEADAGGGHGLDEVTTGAHDSSLSALKRPSYREVATASSDCEAVA